MAKIMNWKYFTNYKFIFLLGDIQIGFRRIQNMEYSIEHETILEGGLNEYPHTVPAPKKSQHKIVLEKGASPNSIANSRLVGVHLKALCMIIVLGEDSKPALVYELLNPYITSWNMSAMDAIGSEILIDSIEMIHEGLRLVKG